MKNRGKTKPNYNWTGKHILIIEPDPCNCMLLEIHLRPTNCQRIFIHSANEAIHFADRIQIVDLILIEIFLPQKVGWEIIRMFKKGSPHIPIVVQTVLAFETVRRDCIDTGADGFMEKPLGFEVLMGMMDGLLGC